MASRAMRSRMRVRVRVMGCPLGVGETSRTRDGDKARRTRIRRVVAAALGTPTGPWRRLRVP